MGLNFADVFCALGLYKAAPSGPFIPGLEFSGVVTAVRPPADPAAAATPSLAPGDRVIGVTRFGAWATHVALDADYLRPIPEGWSFAQAASFAVQALTAAHGFKLGDLEAAGRRRDGGATVLLQSAAGGVGLQALEICRARGARVLGLVGSEAKAAQLRRLLEERGGGGSSGGGGSFSVDVVPRARGEAAARAQLREWLDGKVVDGFDVFLDSAGGDYLRPGFDALAPCGR